MRLLCLPSRSAIQEDGSVAEPLSTRCPLMSRRSASTGKGCGHVKAFPAGACGVPGVPADNTITSPASQQGVRGCCRTAPLDAPRSFLCLLLTVLRMPAGRAVPCPVARRLQPAWAGLRLLQLQRNSHSCHLIQCLLN